MSSGRISNKEFEVENIYQECRHALKEIIEIPIEVRTNETPKDQKRNSSSSYRSSRRNSWKSFLCSSAEQVESESDSDAGLDFQCAGLPQLVKNVEGLCPYCIKRQKLLIVMQEARDAEITLAQIAQLDEERVRQRPACPTVADRRTQFRCVNCIRENRNSADRRGNEGFCCEHGRVFWNTMLGAKKLSKLTAQLKQVVVDAAEARRVARQAPASYGWKSHADEFIVIEPEVVAQFLEITGSQPGFLPGLAVPRYEDAHIDIERWNSQIQTSHGTAPAPNKPLPMIPLQRKPRAEQVIPQPPSTERHGFLKELTPLRTRESDVSAMTTPLDLDDVSPVSSMSTRWPSNSQRPKTREGGHNLMSDLEYEIDSVLESWK